MSNNHYIIFNLKEKINTSLVLKMHGVLANKFSIMTNSTFCIIKETENFYVSIGKIIDLRH